MDITVIDAEWILQMFSNLYNSKIVHSLGDKIS